MLIASGIKIAINLEKIIVESIDKRERRIKPMSRVSEHDECRSTVHTAPGVDIPMSTKRVMDEGRRMTGRVIQQFGLTSNRDEGVRRQEGG